MAYKPYKSIGSRKFQNLSGSGTLEAVGATTLGGALNVTGAITLEGPASGSVAGPGSQMALDASGLVVLDSSNMQVRVPIGCYFSSSAVGDSCTTISLIPSLGSIDGKAIVPITSGSTLINAQITSTLTADIEGAPTGAGALDEGTVDPDNSKGYYVFLITKADAADPALIFSRNPISPLMPATYTYKSEALFYAYRNATYDTWQKFSHRTDGWTYSRHTLASSLTATSETAVDCRDLLPSGGEAMIQVRAENTSTTNRNIIVGINSSIVTGSTFQTFRPYSIRDNEASRITAYVTYLIPVPVSGAINDDETFTYNWSGAVTVGAAFFTLAFRTSAYCR